MGIFHRLIRYAFLALSIGTLVIGIKACSPPVSNQPTAPASPVAMSPSGSMSMSNKPKININTAILSQLDKLEAALGVPALSNKIQASRPYGSIDDLVSKKVIDQAQFDQIKNQVTIEEVVLTGEAKDVDYMTKLGLMKGHMIVAGELLALKKPDQAEPHIGHPVEEIYVDLEEQFQERKVEDFKGVLTQLQDLVKSKPNDPQIKTQYDQAMKAIDQAIAVLPNTQRQSTNFSLQVVNGLLETAKSEYTAAISNGKISAPIEYQDSRGFVAYAQDTVYKGIADQIKQADPKVNEQIVTSFTGLRKAWPSPVPPATPVLTADQVATKVKQIELSSAPVIQASIAK
ncbi:MAG: DNA uptake protein [Leptolyngbya sp.]|nr:MAG: DNA uptake protein [Leptolyngbya sp.]